MKPTPKSAAKIQVHPEVLAMARRMSVKDPVKAALKYVQRNMEGGTTIGPAAYVVIEQDEKRGSKNVR